MATASEMVATSVRVSPGCGAAGIRCCSDRGSASLGGISDAGRWAGSSSSVGAGVTGAQQRRCPAAAAGAVFAAGSAGFDQKIKSSSVAVGAVDFACGANSRDITRGGDCDLLLLQRRLPCCEDAAGQQQHAAAAAASPAAAGAEAGGGTGGGDGEETACVPAWLQHPVSGDESDASSSSRSGRLLRRSSKDAWAAGNSKLSPTEAVGTSCPDFLLFFPRSPKKNCCGSENTKKTLFLAAAAGAASGSDSSTCGSACVSTDDERASGCSRQDHDASKKNQRLSSSSPRPHNAEAAAPAAVTEGRGKGGAGGEGDGAASGAGAGRGGDEDAAAAAQVVPRVHVRTPAETPGKAAAGGATLASIVTCAAAVPVPDACAAVQQSLAEEGEQLGRPSAAEPQQTCSCAGADSSEDACGARSLGEARREDFLVPRDSAAEEATAAAAGGGGGTTGTTEATALAGEEAARDMREEAAAAAEGVDAQAAESTAKHERIPTAGGGEGSAAGREKTNGAAHACTRVDATVLFPSPQPPSLPQLLQLPDVYEAALLALHVLPERYMQRIQQLDALETLCPWVYVRCSFLARVRHIYVVSTELTLRRKEALLQQLLQERSSRQRSRASAQAKPREEQQQQQQGGGGQDRRGSGQQAEEEEEEEDDSCSWNGDREQHKALHAVAELFMEIKAVQTRVGPTLLAGVAQLVDALQALEQQEKKRKESSAEGSGSSSCADGYARSDYSSSNCSCDTRNSSGSSSTCSSFSVSSASASNERREGSVDGREVGEKSDSEGVSRGHEANSTSASCAGSFCMAHCCRSVQALVDNFLHSFFSCRVAAELQREHFLLAVQSGDCGAILSSCLPMEKLIFHAALDAQELALHHLGIAAPVEVWVGEAGEADEQLRAFLLAASLHEGPVAVAWSACSSPRGDKACRPEELDSAAAQCGVSAGGASAAACGEDAAGAAASVRGGTRGGGLASGSEAEAQRQQQEGWKKSGTRVLDGGSGAAAGEGKGEGKGKGEGEGGEGGGSSTCCSGCRSSASSASPRWPKWGGGPGPDYSHGTYNAFSRNSSRSRSSSALPGTVRFPCFASYAYSGIFELLKNSMRASVEAWRLNRCARNSSSGSSGSGSSGSSGSGSSGSGSSGSSGSGSSGEVRSSGVPAPGSQRSSRSESDEQQKWRLLSVKRSRKLKKLPGRVRLQRCCFESAASRQWGRMACSEDVAAAADQERTARSKARENSQPWVQGQPLRRVDEGDFPAREEEVCGEVFQLEDGVLEPIKVLLLFIDESLIIRIEDHGEGLPQNELQNVWSFAYTTAPVKGLLQRLAATSEEQEKENSAAAETTSVGRRASVGNAATAVPPLAGCGVGLPMSRVHAQSLGGDIFLESAEGRGTCAYMCLSNLQGFRDRFHEQHRSRQQRNT